MKPLGHLGIDELRVPPGQEWTDEARAWRFLRLETGVAYWLDPAKPRCFAEGEMLVLAPGIKAVVRASQLAEATLHGFSFDPDLLCGFFTIAERHLIENGGTDAFGPVTFLPSTHPVTQRLAEAIEAHSVSHPLAERVELLGIAALFFGEGVTSRRPTAQLNSAHERFEQIISYMPDLELIHHTPEQLAALCGCSARHFNRLFHARFGESTRERQADLRLLQARHLLATTDDKITQIALGSGYRTLSLFNALFKRRFGMSPSAWRQKQAAQSAAHAPGAHDGN